MSPWWEYHAESAARPYGQREVQNQKCNPHPFSSDSCSTRHNHCRLFEDSYSNQSMKALTSGGRWTAVSAKDSIPMTISLWRISIVLTFPTDSNHGTLVCVARVPLHAHGPSFHRRRGHGERCALSMRAEQTPNKPWTKKYSDSFFCVGSLAGVLQLCSES